MTPRNLFPLPFLMALIVGLAAMPLDIYAFNQREVGTERLTPWERGMSATVHRAVGLWRRLRAMLKTPSFWRSAAVAALLALVLSGSVPHADGLVVAVGLTAPELREQINKLGTDMKALTDKAKAENRNLTPEEGVSFDAMDVDREAKLKEEARWLKIEALDQGTGRRTDPAQPSQRQDGQRPRASEISQADHSEALRGFFLAGSKGRTNKQIEAMRRLGLDTESRSAFIGLTPRPPASTRDHDLREWEKRYFGVNIVSPDDGGHNLIQPSEMLRALEIALLSFGGMREVSTVNRTDTGVSLPFPTMNDTSNEGAEISEGVEETNEVLPVTGQMVLDAFTYSSRKIPVSLEFMQDNAINFEQRVGEILGTRIARITNRRFTTGTGSGQPKGIVTAATSSGITAASATAVSYDELMGVEHSVDPAYRNQRTGPTAAKWMFHDNLLLALKKIKVPQYSGDTAGQPLWRQGFAVGEPDTIDGYQYVINQHMPLPTTGQKALLFGALYKYQIRDVRAVEVVRLNELRAEFRQVVWLAWSRHDGDLLDAGTHPVKHLTMG